MCRIEKGFQFFSFSAIALFRQLPYFGHCLISAIALATAASVATIASAPRLARSAAILA
jgi:hypothetical protein